MLFEKFKLEFKQILEVIFVNIGSIHTNLK